MYIPFMNIVALANPCGRTEQLMDIPMQRCSIAGFLNPIRLTRWALLIGTLATLAFSAPLMAAPLLRCQLIQGGTTRVVEFSPKKDPYGAEAIDVNGRFRFKAVVVGDEDQVEYIKLYTYYQTQRQPVLLHEAKYAAPVAQSTDDLAALTGMNYLYSPRLEREFQYGCALLEVAP